MEPKWSQNGSQNGAKTAPKPTSTPTRISACILLYFCFLLAPICLHFRSISALFRRLFAPIWHPFGSLWPSFNHIFPHLSFMLAFLSPFFGRWVWGAKFLSAPFFSIKPLGWHGAALLCNLDIHITLQTNRSQTGITQKK